MGLILEARSPPFHTVCSRITASLHLLFPVGTWYAVVLASCLVARARSNYVHMMIYQYRVKH